jgi:hypothetical protein
MALSRRQMGLGLLALSAAATTGVAVVGPRRIERLITGRSADQVDLWGFIGGEKLNFVRDDSVRELLSRRHGITLDARRAGSIEMVGDPALTSQKPDWLGPASNLVSQLARRNGLPVRRDEIVLNSPIVIYSWSPIVEALVRRGYVEGRDGAHYLVKTRELIDDIVKATTWRDLGLELYGRVMVSSTDPTKSNSGFTFAGLLANLLAGDVAGLETLPRDLDTIASIFDRMGFKEPSSGTQWDAYLNQGMGGKPLLVGYESQLIEFILGDAARWKTLQAQPRRPVMLYPVPTVYTSHPVISLTEKADRLIPALTDPDLLEIAWSKHGFRGPLGAVGRGGAGIAGVATAVENIMPMPAAPVMLAVLERLSRGRG